jgi:hypothetical protein
MHGEVAERWQLRLLPPPPRSFRAMERSATEANLVSRKEGLG